MAALIKFRLPVYIWAIFILFSSATKETAPGYLLWVPYLDKWLHAAEYAILGLLLARMLKNLEFGFSNKKALTLSIAICGVYGAMMEFYQGFLPYRSAEIFDLTADLAGATIGALVYLGIRHGGNKAV